MVASLKFNNQLKIQELKNKKINEQNKIIFLPTYLDFFQAVIVNTTFILFGLRKNECHFLL